MTPTQRAAAWKAHYRAWEALTYYADQRGGDVVADELYDHTKTLDAWLVLALHRPLTLQGRLMRMVRKYAPYATAALVVGWFIRARRR